jgi:hypothetical protein
LETVALLIHAGANTNAKDKENNTPLHACCEFTEEKLLWANESPGPKLEKIIEAKGILKNDTSRIQARDSFSQPQHGRAGMWGYVSNENDTCQMSEIVKILLRYGAEIDLMNNQRQFAIDRAVDKGCVGIVAELSPLMEAIYALPSDQVKYGWGGNRRGDPFRKDYLMMRNAGLLEMLKDKVQEGNQNFGLCNHLLALGHFEAISQLLKMGARQDLLSFCELY